LDCVIISFFTHLSGEEPTIIPVDTCNSCGESLHDLDCVEHERRTKIDIVFEKVVEHFDAEVKQCPNCNTVEKGKFPIDVHPPVSG